MANAKIGFVVLGAFGYMGQNGVGAIAKLTERLAREFKISLRLVGFIDPAISSRTFKDVGKQTAWDCLSKVHELFGYVPRIDSDVEAMGHLIATFNGSERHPVVIYDASPSINHSSNLDVISRLQREHNLHVLYIGEKPIFLDPGCYTPTKNSEQDEVDWARRTIPDEVKFFCELVELENPIFKAAKQIVTRDSLTIDELWFWRAGSSAVKKAVGTDRAGVMGGAIEDKSLHDFSLTVGLLDPANLDIEQFSGTAVRYSGVENLCISHASVFGNEESFLSKSNEPIKLKDLDLSYRGSFPADACSRLDFAWPLKNGKEVKAHYLFSWIGQANSSLEEEFKSLFGIHNINLPVGGKWQSAKDLEYFEEEVRVGVIDCTRPNGKRITLLCNFLYKEDYSCERFLYVVEDGEISETVRDSSQTTYEDVKSDDMCCLFESVAKCGLGLLSYSDILCGRQMTLLTHKALLLSQKAFRAALANQVNGPTGQAWLKGTMKSSIDLIARKIRAKSLVAQVGL